MKLALNGWQRLWVVISVLLLIPAAFLVVVFWPYPEGDLIKELGSPACKMWRDVPDGYFIDESPSYPSECYNLRALLNNKIILRSVADYDKHLVRTKVKLILIFVGVWVGIISAVYLIGWSTGWIFKGFRKHPA